MNNRTVLLIILIFSCGILYATEMATIVDTLLQKAERAYYINGDDSLACKYIEQAINIHETEGKVNDRNYAKLLSLWCSYGADSFNSKAITMGEQALEMLKESHTTIEYAECLSSLAYCYTLVDDSLDQYSDKSVDYCLEAINIISRIENFYVYIRALSHLSQVYYYTGKYQKSIDIADKCIMYADSCMKEIKHCSILYRKYCDSYSLALHNKANALYSQGKYIDCLTFLRKNVQFRLNVWGKGCRYAISVRNIATLEEKLGYYKEAFNHYVECLNTLHENNRLSRIEEIELICNLVDLELKLGELHNARPRFYFLQSIVDNFELKNNKEIYAHYLNTIIKYWLYVGDYPTAYHYLQEVYEYDADYYLDDDIHVQLLLTVKNNSLAYEVARGLQQFYDEKYGISHYVSLHNIPNVIKSAISIDNWDVAYANSIRYLYGMRKYVSQMLPYMTPEERDLFIRKEYYNIFQYLPYIFNLTRKEKYKQAMYDLILFQKGLLLRAEKELIDLVNKNKRKDAIMFYNDIREIYFHIKNEYSYDRRDSLYNVFQQKIIKLHKLVPNMNDYLNQFYISYYDVKKCLKNNEITIEFVDITDNQTGTKSCKALVLAYDSEFPYYIDLFNEADLSNIDKDDYYSTDYLYALIWVPIFSRLSNYENINKVYFSPSNMISHIAIESLLDYQGQRISDSIDYVRLTSTREITKHKNSIISNGVVYGGLNYDVEPSSQFLRNKQYQFNKTNQSLIIDSIWANNIHSVCYLPNTKIEAETINKELRKRCVKTKLFEEANGTEESFIKLNKEETNILHIATHGFYWTQTKLDSMYSTRASWLCKMGINTQMSSEEKALTRSGLFLSGANKSLRGLCVNGINCDGLLTAYEISKLYFDNLDIVVLSACNSGLGDVQKQEGILGLQRGFKKAGANSILMSLWNVDDCATQILMVEFYKNYLGGESKTISLRKAQQYVKLQPGFEDPYYWAGFILLDGLN